MKAAFISIKQETLSLGKTELSAACIQLKMMLLTEIMDRAKAGYETFYSGVARGVDLIFARQVLLVKATEYPDIRLVCVLPHEGQANNWCEAWRERYFTTLEQADDVVTLSPRYTPDCYRRANQYMIDRSDALLVVYSEAFSGGSTSVIKYARRRNKEIVAIDPSTLKREVIPPGI